jgi:molybdenum cofactor guanylyltransferase
MTAEGDGVAGVLLAGGLSRRMGGGDKCLKTLAGRPLLAHVIERMRPQVRMLALNANGDGARFAGFGLPVVPDTVADFPGPLAGVLAGLDWADAAAPDCPWLVSVPTDAPFLPHDLVRRLQAAVGGEGGIAVAASGGRTHPVAALWPLALTDALRQAIAAGVRKVEDFTASWRVVAVEFATDPVDPFFNLNRPEDLREAERFLDQRPSQP